MCFCEIEEDDKICFVRRLKKIFSGFFLYLWGGKVKKRKSFYGFLLCWWGRLRNQWGNLSSGNYMEGKSNCNVFNFLEYYVILCTITPWKLIQMDYVNFSLSSLWYITFIQEFRMKVLYFLIFVDWNHI